MIAEAVYSTAIKGTTLQLGYRGRLSGMDNSVTGSSTGAYDSDISTDEHRAFAEAVWRHGNWSAQGSMAAELHTTKTATGSDRSFDFTPSLMLNYKINKNNSLRLDLSSATENPEMQQLSEWRVQVMEGLCRTGNPSLRTSASYEAGLRYSFQIPQKIVARLRGFMAEDRRHIFMNIVEDGADMDMRYDNADYYRELGANVTLSWYPTKWLTLGAQADLVRQSLFADSFSEEERLTFFRPTVSVGLNFGKFSASYTQTLANDYLHGLYIEGWENISSISLTYKAKKNLRIGLQCLFPFIEDEVSVRSTAQTPVVHNYDLDMRTKNRSLGFTISWNFSH